MIANYLWLIISGAVLIILIVLFFVLLPVKVLTKATFSGVRIPLRALSSMKIRKINASFVVDEYIYAKKAGIDVALEELETHFLSGGNIRNVVDAMIATKNVSVDLSVDTAKALDLSGVNVSQIVNESITPREIITPVISSFCMDGKELQITLSITLKTNLAKFLGGAKESTIIARATESAICIISSTKKSADITSDPEIVSQFVMSRHIGEKTAYDVLGVHVTKVEIGRDLIKEQAEYEREQRKLEKIRTLEEEKAMTVLEQENTRLRAEQENLKKAQMEAEIPKNILKSFEDGKIDLLEYYKMQNIIADTNMRKALAIEPKKEEKKKIRFDFDDLDPDIK